MTASSATVTTDLPARLDRLPWSGWHWRILIGLGTVWILDGLEVTVVGSLGPRLTDPASGVGLTESSVGVAASVYVVGACLGALVFGQLTERFGRKRLFMLTLGLYLLATVATAFSVAPWMFFVCRFFTGAGVGGEYSAINSAIDELMPARLRGRIDLMVNGSYWLGAAAGAMLTVVVLDESLFPAFLGWRLAFGLGAIFGLTILLVRRHVPESPRWLTIHGHHDQARRVVDDVEHDVERRTGERLPQVDPDDALTIRARGPVGIGEIARAVFGTYRRRSVLTLSLFVGQAFLYNAVFFTQGLVLTRFFGVDGAHIGYYIVPLALGNFLGPVLLGRLFDTVGRKVMLTTTYVGSGVLLLATAWLFASGVFSAWTLTAAWSAVFFLASAGTSAAYLTASEIFPMETRAMAIAFYYAVGTGLGGIVGPVLFARLVDTGRLSAVAGGYVLGAGLMVAAGVVAAFLAVDAEQKSLEDIAEPLSSAQVPQVGAAHGEA